MTLTLDDPTANQGVDEEGGSDSEAASSRNGRGNASLFYTPVVILLAAGVLWWYVSSKELIPQQSLPLDWSLKLQPQIIQHIKLAVVSTAIVLVVAIPLGIMMTRPSMRKYSAPVLWVANTGQSFPAYGLFVVALFALGQGFWTSVIALAFFAMLPVLRNTMVGLDQVDTAVIEAGRGMGLTRMQALRSIELPLAVPVMLAGIRTALVINVGQAALAFLIGGGGLGVTIDAGLKLQQNIVIITGAALTAILALSMDWFAALAERYLSPKGLR